MKTSNEAERTIIEELERILVIYGASWEACENCTFASINPKIGRAHV